MCARPSSSATSSARLASISWRRRFISVFACVAASSSSARASARSVARWASFCVRESELSELLSFGALLRERGLRLLQCHADLRELGDERVAVRLGSLHLLGRAVEVSLTFGQTLLQQLDAVVGGL